MDLNEEIKRRICAKFPFLSVSIFPDETQDNIIVAIDNDLYYSDEYLALVMDIKTNVLWANNIFNYLFVKERRQSSFVPISFSVRIALSLGTVLNSPLVLRGLPKAIFLKPSKDIKAYHNIGYTYAGDPAWLLAA
jgi:hypothetical protein